MILGDQLQRDHRIASLMFREEFSVSETADASANESVRCRLDRLDYSAVRPGRAPSGFSCDDPGGERRATN